MKTRTARVVLSPAHLGDYGGIVTEICSPKARATDISFTSIDEMKQKVTAYANACAGGWTASVFITDGGRKPNGFEAAKSDVRYHNLTTEDAAA
jgi:hypothetical protein